MKTTLAQAVEDYLRACELVREARAEHQNSIRIQEETYNKAKDCEERRERRKENLQTAIDAASEVEGEDG